MKKRRPSGSPFPKGGRYRTVYDPRGKKFREYTYNKEFKKSARWKKSMQRGDMKEFYESEVQKEYAKFYRTQRKKGRHVFSFRVSVGIRVKNYGSYFQKLTPSQKRKNKGISDFISSRREELYEDIDFENTMKDFSKDFTEFMDKYLLRMGMSAIDVNGVSMTVLVPEAPKKKRKIKRKPKKRARKSKKASGKKKKAKTISSPRQRKR